MLTFYMLVLPLSVGAVCHHVRIAEFEPTFATASLQRDDELLVMIATSEIVKRE
jgi:hypothetical protein